MLREYQASQMPLSKEPHLAHNHRRIQVGANGAEALPNFFQIRFLIDGSLHRNVHWDDIFV